MADDRQTSPATPSRAAGARQALLRTTPAAELKIAMPLGVPAFAAAIASLTTCYGSILVSGLFDVRTEHLINPHVQAVLMWGFGLLAVFALWQDRRHHCNSIPLGLALVGAATLIGTLYLRYDVKFEAFSYVLLVIAALLNWVLLLGAMNRTVAHQAREIEVLNRNLERRVESQDQEIGRLARLRQFLAPQVAEMVVSDSQESLLASHRGYIACLFCDIRGFTALSEEIEPEEVIAILQKYHDDIGRLVVRHRGTLGYRAGDGLMVFFNDPVRCDEPVFDAVKLAVDIRAAFDEIRGPWSTLGHRIGLGIGIASGYATLGLVGFEGRADYTAIGGVVNIASRLCDNAADGQILLSQRAYHDVESNVLAERVGMLKLKGVRNEVETYRFVEMNRSTSD